MLLTNAILHIVGNSEETTRFSNIELDVDSEATFEFVGKHTRRLLNAPAAKEATFRATSPVYTLVGQYQRGDLHFKELSWKLCERLAALLQQHKDIPPADLLVAAFDHSKRRYLAIVKLSCGECFTHRIVERDGITETHLIKNMDMLPLTASKVEAACVIPFDPMILRVVETQHPVDGAMMDYFSELFLCCDAEMSRQEAAEILRDTATEINEEFFDGNVEMEAKIKAAIIEAAAEEKGEVYDVESAARIAFHDQPEAAERFLQRVDDAGLPRDVKLDRGYVERKFKTQVIRADNGVEIKLPLEVAHNPELVQIEQNLDGSFSIVLKHLRSKVE